MFRNRSAERFSFQKPVLSVERRRNTLTCLLNKGDRTNGFSLAEALLALLITAMAASLITMQTGILSSGLSLHEDSQEQFAILQLRELAAASRNLHVENGVLELEHNGKHESISADRGRLVKKPGYEIFMEEIDWAVFRQEKGVIVLEYSSHGQTQTWQIR